MKDRVITSEEGEMIDASYDRGFNDGYRKGLDMVKEFTEWKDLNHWFWCKVDKLYSTGARRLTWDQLFTKFMKERKK